VKGKKNKHRSKVSEEVNPTKKRGIGDVGAERVLSLQSKRGV
jgi:hypothetical protein